MSEIFKKLNLKEQKEILVLNPPESFEPELTALEGITVQRSLADMEGIDFSLAFAMVHEAPDPRRERYARYIIAEPLEQGMEQGKEVL